MKRARRNSLSYYAQFTPKKPSPLRESKSDGFIPSPQQTPKLHVSPSTSTSSTTSPSSASESEDELHTVIKEEHDKKWDDWWGSDKRARKEGQSLDTPIRRTRPLFLVKKVKKVAVLQPWAVNYSLAAPHSAYARSPQPSPPRKKRKSKSSTDVSPSRAG